MIAVDNLVAADRIVLAGLSAYDRAMARAWKVAAARMASAGYSADEIAEWEQGHLERALSGRGKLHRELWTKALVHLALPLGPGSDEVEAIDAKAPAADRVGGAPR